MLTSSEFSVFHRLKSDEVWHHYDGGSMTLHIIDGGKLSGVRLGNGSGESAQAVVKANTWCATSLKGKTYCLVGCTMSLGFHYSDGELGKREEPLTSYSKYRAIIKRYTIV